MNRKKDIIEYKYITKKLLDNIEPNDLVIYNEQSKLMHVIANTPDIILMYRPYYDKNLFSITDKTQLSYYRYSTSDNLGIDKETLFFGYFTKYSEQTIQKALKFIYWLIQNQMLADKNLINIQKISVKKNICNN